MSVLGTRWIGSLLEAKGVWEETSFMGQTNETLVEQARKGDKHALEALIRRIQDRIYGLALRMLGDPADAEDATQEILVKIVTHLASFRQESAFTTWGYRIASNHLLTENKRRARRKETSFEQFGEQCDRGLGVSLKMPFEAEQNLLVEEIKISCMQSILQCLDLDSRIAYILGEIFEVTSDEGGYVLNISPAAFRKRLSRARALIRDFMGKKCSLVNPVNPCHCKQQVGPAIKAGRLDPQNLLYATHPCHAKKDVDTLNGLHEMNQLQRIAVLFRSHPDYLAHGAFVESIKELLDSGKFKLFGEPAEA
jgi:RNA polymerase sigma factor (sigma-70 family)